MSENPVRENEFTLVSPNDVALILGANGDITLCIPGETHPPLSAQRLALVILAGRFDDPAWVETMVAERFRQMIAEDLAAESAKKNETE
jgi:hypothetical protein